MTERPQNARPSRAADRTHNGNRFQPPVPDPGVGTRTTIVIRAYRGSHRAERMPRTDDRTAAQHRSRMGRHHAEQRDYETRRRNRW